MGRFASCRWDASATARRFTYDGAGRRTGTVFACSLMEDLVGAGLGEKVGVFTDGELSGSNRVTLNDVVGCRTYGAESE